MVDGTGLENQQVNSFAGSNPVPSARNGIIKNGPHKMGVIFYCSFILRMNAGFDSTAHPSEAKDPAPCPE